VGHQWFETELLHVDSPAGPKKKLAKSTQKKKHDQNRPVESIRFGPWNLREKKVGLLQLKTQLCQIDPFSKGSK